MGKSKNSLFLAYEFEKLSNTLIAMDSVKDGITQGIFTRIGAFPRYTQLMKTSNDIVKILTGSGYLIPEDMGEIVSKAISYTRSVQGDLFREMTYSPCVTRQIHCTTSNNSRLDDKIYELICCLESIVEHTATIKRIQSTSIVGKPNTEHIQLLIKQCLSLIEKSAWIWSNEVLVIIQTQNKKIDTSFINKIPDLTYSIIANFGSTCSRHISGLNRTIEYAIQSSIMQDRPREERIMFDTYMTTMNAIQESVDRDIDFLMQQSADVDIDGKIAILKENLTKFFSLKKTYDILTEPFIFSKSHALHIGQQSTGRV